MMKKLFIKKLVSILLLLCSYNNLFAQQDLKLWYNQPSEAWTDAMPLGNGRLGAMVYGIVESDTIQINEDTFWSGSPYQNINPDASKYLKTIQECIANENYAERSETFSNAHHR
jgi:alpha-L-fucosidase 2